MKKCITVVLASIREIWYKQDITWWLFSAD
jgi:hypothetical protein